MGFGIPVIILTATLSGWIEVADPHAAPPGVLVEQGEIVISSNIVPDLWRLRAGTGRFERVPITVEPTQVRDIGFTMLRRAADGSIHARHSIDASLWRIDLEQGHARRLDDQHR